MNVFGRLHEVGIVPVVEIEDTARAVELGETLLGAGLPVVEVTFRTPAAAAAIDALSALRPELTLLAGTITEPGQVAQAQEAGADLLVAPGLGVPVVEEAQRRDIAILPGVATPTEIDRARGLGLDAVKVFPAEPLGGPAFLRAVSGPFAGLRWAPSGGIKVTNLGSYLELDSVLACSGTWIAPRAEIAAGEFEVIAKRAAEAVAAVRAIRPGERGER